MNTQEKRMQIQKHKSIQEILGSDKECSDAVIEVLKWRGRQSLLETHPSGLRRAANALADLLWTKHGIDVEEYC